jgi:hypothetical protein
MEQILSNSNDRRLWFRIKALEKKLDQLGAIGSEGFEWLQWEDLTDERVSYETQLSVHKDVVKKVLSRYGRTS